MTNWAIVGLGKIAQKFATDLQTVPNAKLWAVASTSLDRANEFAKQFDAPHTFGSYEALADCPNLDVVYIATPHPQHAQLALFFLQKSIAVLVEKPWAMNADEARRMVVTARRQGVFLMEALWTRFVPGFQKMMSLIEADEIGEILTVRADFGFKAPPFDLQSRIFNPKMGAGSLLDIGIYPVLLSQILLGKPEKILAHATFTELGADENCAMTFIYPENRLALLHSSIAVTTPTDAYIFGTKGTIYLNRRFHHPTKITLSRYDGRLQTHEDFEIPYDGWGLRYEAEHVTECLEKGLTESPLVSLDFSLELTELLDWVRAECGIEYH